MRPPFVIACFILSSSAYSLQDNSKKKEQMLLKILNLPSLPKKAVNNTVPSFLSKIYESQTNDRETFEGEYGSTINRKKITAYRTIGVTDTELPIVGKSLDFEVRKDFSVNDTSFEVYLYLYKKKAKVTTTVYGFYGNETVVLGTRNIRSSFDRWIRFNVTEYFVSQEASTFRLLVNTNSTVDADKVIDFREDTSTSPYVAVFERISEDDFYAIDYNLTAVVPQNCELQLKYVEFEKLGLENIIAPKGFNMNYCSGECGFNSKVGETRHALMQNYLKTFGLESFPSTSCVPTKLSSVGVILVDSENHPVMTEYKDLVADACGCL